MSNFTELGIPVGAKVRLNEDFLPSEAVSPREQFFIKEAPAHGNDGTLVLEGLISQALVYITANEDAISEVVKE